MKITVITLLSAVVVAFTFAADAQSPTTKISAAGVWQPPQDVFTKASKACQAGSPDTFSDCYLKQLAALGEPAAAADVTHWLYEHFDKNVGILAAFRGYGSVDAAQVMIPLRANDNYSLLLVNGDPELINVDDVQKLDRAAMEKSPPWQQLKRKYPNADLWPGDRSGANPWPQRRPLPDGGARFVVQYPIINGCHACARVGHAQFGWDFDGNGKFLRVTYLGLRTTTS
jgi:hypothetical protein